MVSANVNVRTQELAYYIWERQGRPEGQALDHWFQAEAELTPKVKPKKKRSRTTKSAAAASRARPAPKSAQTKRR